MKKIVLMLSGCMLFASLSFAQQDTTINRSKSARNQSNMSNQNDTNKKDSTKKRKNNKKGGKRNNMDSTATMSR